MQVISAIVVCTDRAYAPAVATADRLGGRVLHPDEVLRRPDPAVVHFLTFGDARPPEVAENALVVCPWSEYEASGPAVLLHGPIMSELAAQTASLKYRRTIDWVYGPNPLPWLSDDDLADACVEWVREPWQGARKMRGPQTLDGVQVAALLSACIREAIDPERFVELKFASADRDEDGRLTLHDVVAMLLAVGVSAGEAQRIFERAAGSDGISRAGFAVGLEDVLAQALSGVESKVVLHEPSADAALDFFLNRGWSEEAARRMQATMAAPMDEGVVGPTTLMDWALARVTDWIAVQILPGHGILSGRAGRIDGRPALISRLRAADGREAHLERTVDYTRVRLRWLDAGAGEIVRWGHEEVERRLTVQDGRVVEIEVRGLWTDLPRAEEYFMTGERFPHWLAVLFRTTGEFQIEKAVAAAAGDIVCNCTQTTCGRIQQLMDGGARTLTEIAAETRATTVCGGCRPLVEEFLGSSDLHQAELVAKESLGGGVWRYTLRPVGVEVVRARPGEHILLQARIGERWVTRAYTLTSSDGAYEICVKREEFGEFSRWLADKAGTEDLFRISQPRGDFVPDDQATRRIIFIVGGIGVTPALATARALHAAGEGARSLQVLWSAPRHENFVFREEIERIALEHPNWRLELRPTRESGRLSQDDLAAFCGKVDDSEILLCGPVPFMDSVRTHLLALGWPQTAIRQELFASRLDERGKVRPQPKPALRAGDVVLVEASSLFVQPVTSVEEEARAFLSQCYTEQGLADVLAARWTEVEASIRTSGTWVQTYDEITFGARLAWRNSNRCLGRNFWRNLQVRDMRHLDSPAQMFEAVLDHIRIATNGGDLRPTMTVFKADGRRIWNPQFFRYAGWRQTDGTMIGDPMQVELTERAVSLGWRPASYGRFDYLPLIIEVPGQQPQWFEIPPELIVEVPLTHPHLDWFAGLDLKWYGLPAVSNMAFDVGGIQYLAAPFNGFYMGTEVGARNFGDADRYDMLGRVAEKLGLDTSSERTLWRDRAVVEMNIAVLHSFAQRGVRMLDHHTLTDSFMQFAAAERTCGRPVQADRDYMVPPISGSLTPTFHAVFDGNRLLKPNFFYQESPWTVNMGCPLQ